MNNTLASTLYCSCLRIGHTRTTYVEFNHRDGTINMSADTFSEHKDSLPPLNDAQIVKLKQLSLVSLAQDSRVGP